MGGDEKAQQIGVALKQYSDAKIVLAQLDTKLRTVAEAYKQVGQAIEQSAAVRLKVEHGRVLLTYAPHFDGADLLVACRRVTITRRLASKLSWPLAAKSCLPRNSIPT
jgi:hypothetical protein